MVDLGFDFERIWVSFSLGGSAGVAERRCLRFSGQFVASFVFPCLLFRLLVVRTSLSCSELKRRYRSFLSGTSFWFGSSTITMAFS